MSRVAKCLGIEAVKLKHFWSIDILVSSYRRVLNFERVVEFN